jgi:acyl-CoA dehydrogenase
MERILEHILAADTTLRPIADVDAWLPVHREVAEPFASPIERALAGGFAADRLGYAFASGLREALRRLVPAVGDTSAALCATEEGGAHPRAIATRLEEDGDGFRLTGEKTWSTLGTRAEELLVAASVGPDETGKNLLAFVRIPAARDGVRVTAMPATPFVPEIPHASVTFDNVRVEAHERLEGDGYNDYLKPFRTVEDCHVYAALLAYLFAVGRRARFGDEHLEALAGVLAALCGLANADPSSPGVHIALAGVFAEGDRVLAESEPAWRRVDEESRARWTRDRALLGFAGNARAARRAAAWRSIQALAEAG